MRYSRLWLLVGIALVLFAAGCGSSSDDDGGNAAGGGDSAEKKKPLPIGFAIDKTSWLAPYDVPAKTAAEIAIEQINAEGGLMGRQLTTTEADTKATPEVAGNAGIQVLEDGAEFMVASCDFDLGGPAAREGQKRGVLVFGTCVGSLDWGPIGIGDLAFTMGAPALTEGSIVAEYAYEEQNIRNAYTLLDPSIDYENQLCDGFTKRFEALGGKIVGADSFQQEDQSISAQVSRLKSTPEAEMIFLCSYAPGMVRAMRQIRAAGVDIPIMSGLGLDGDFWKKAVPKIDNLFYATYASRYGDDPDDKVNEFFELYREKTGELPDTGTAITGYNVVEAFALAAERAKSTEGAALSAELQKFQDEQLLGVTVSFTDEYHIDLCRAMRIMEVKEGKSSYVTMGEPDEVPLREGNEVHKCSG